jgi:trans-aconitate 2-methyltransferase
VIWDPDQYLRFEKERALPFHHLIAAAGDIDPRLVVDLGCGSGGRTATLLERWPEATIIGVDKSEAMVERARQHAGPEQLEFVLADVSTWRSRKAVDLMISNACFHWIDDHRALFDHLVPQLAPAGVVAFQVPANHDQPSHTILRELCASARWQEPLVGLPRTGTREPSWYVRQLGERGFEVSAWQTTYFHVLGGEDAVLEWLRGTALRPVFERLPEDEHSDFLTEYGALLGEAYPERDGTTVFPFRRTFVVARLAP